MSRIAYISSTFPDYQACGTGIYAGYLTEALAQQGHDVHVITTALPEIRAAHGKVTVHKILEKWSLLELPKLLQAFMKIRPDLIHINHPTTIAGAKTKVLVNFLPEVNRLTWRLPLVTTLHEFGNVSMLGKLKIMPMILASDAITVTNEHYRQKVQSFLPEELRDRVHVVNIGSAFKPYLGTGENQMDEKAQGLKKKEQRARWDIKADDQVIGFVGFITPPKGFHNLIAAAGPLLRRQSGHEDLSAFELESFKAIPAARDFGSDRKRKDNQTGDLHRLSRR